MSITNISDTPSDSDTKSGAEKINPYNTGRPKGVEVEEMFDSIAPAYDFMNTAMSFGLHRRWRNLALDMAREMIGHIHTPAIIDLATGTGDVAFSLAKRFPDSHITGVDLSAGMLEIARRKREEKTPEEAQRINFEQGDCLDLRFPDNTFDLATIAYGVRNFENLLKGLKEIYRTLRPRGACVIIELSRPRQPLAQSAYDLYSRLLIPLAGRMASGDNRAYRYLPESIREMPQREEMTAIMQKAGFSNCSFRSLTFGVVCIYTAVK